MTFPVLAMALPEVVKQKLIASSYINVSNVLAVTPAQLSRDCGISSIDAQRVAAACQLASRPPAALIPGARTALELLEEERMQRSIVTFCIDLDDLLGGGICTRQITELCGEPGAGKTQFGMQLSLNVQIPEELGGLGGQALYIDTEGSFSTVRAPARSKLCSWHSHRPPLRFVVLCSSSLRPSQDRVEQMAQALCAHLQAAAQRSGNPSDIAAAQRTSPSAMLDQIYVSRVHSHREQVALARSLPAFLERNPGVRLVVVDSVAFHFRHGFDDYAARTRTLLAHALQLLRVAVEYNLAVVLINQVTTKVGQAGGGQSASGQGGGGGEADAPSVIAPALGETWAHVSNTRIILSKGIVQGELERAALVDKSATTPRVSVPFRVSAEGVRSVRRKPTAKRAHDALSGSGGGGDAADYHEF